MWKLQAFHTQLNSFGVQEIVFFLRLYWESRVMFSTWTLTQAGTALHGT